MQQGRSGEVEVEVTSPILERFVTCPSCNGIGMEVSPRFRKQDPVCVLCHGMKIVAEAPCGCGRPRRFDARGWVEEAGVFCCGFAECVGRLEKRGVARAEKVWPTHKHHNTPGFTVYDKRRGVGYEENRGSWMDGWIGGGD